MKIRPVECQVVSCEQTDGHEESLSVRLRTHIKPLNFPSYIDLFLIQILKRYARRFNSATRQELLVVTSTSTACNQGTLKQLSSPDRS